MIALIGAVFVASLIGSVHCAGMCGAFLTFAVASDPERATSPAGLHAAYNLGRLMTYVALGCVAGAVGMAIDLGGAAVGLQRVAAVVAGGMMLVFGGVAVLRAAGVHVQRARVPAVLQRLAMKGHRAAGDLPALHRAWAVGLLTTLLPCGWLYAFVISAAGTASPVMGAVAMAIFWLGTLPVMIGLGVGVQMLTGPLRSHLPLVTSLAIVCVGLWTVVGRVQMPVLHGQAAVGVEGVAAADGVGHGELVKKIETLEPTCCEPRP
ncbi:sulfite exporter TauE/SafE family protein [Synechococcus sp. Cruz CV-v-12]|uniref:sulfite exporter TauE/SafE family protein n=1 Tax=Synechococcus sp. Cruz CV-v-12 TaxID=2823728 RepID=UPI0020CD43BD|nr:sulfite exporter TauE/SafE family protein [Synechococcus sp. Cruz CV-v-12]MCP9874711.1 sulfite exporter TauE/SafE family protein [Synechococcus sp. Cruz CV-v-12]